MRLSPNTILQNRYYVHQLIGQGSTGAVYRATDQRLEIDVAVKQIVRRDAASQQAFAQEARLLAKLRHPALPKVLDYFTDETGRFLVMEYIPGPDLSKALLRRVDPFPLRQVLDWGEELLAVLTYLHEQQPAIIHRDIKPANLKLTDQERLMLLDFGLAQRPFPYPDNLAIGYTQHYAPPEQIRGQAVDARSDLYALAATLYDLATGVKPPDAVQQRQSALAAGQPDPLQPAHEHQPIISAAVAGVLQQAMALDPSERYASARDMQLALEDARRRQTAVPHNLPAQVTPFVGRRQMMRAARQRLVTEGARLLTLTGPGGVGKTRLSLQVAAALRENFPDGVFFVPLASLRDPTLVVSAVAQALGVKESGSQSLRAAVQEQLADKQTLLLLDNFEHLLDAALLVADLLANCPRLTVLVTSRSLLQLRGEHQLLVQSLSLPERNVPLSLRDVLQYTAVQLFVQRAQAATPGFKLDEGNVTAVAEICRRLDGLPLAIELAAAHVRALSPAQILDRLTKQFDLLRGGPRDLPARQQALRATLDWSYDLLTPAEQTLFRRLAVFAGGWTLEAATAVCQPAADDPAAAPLSIEDGLTSLVDKSLIQRQESADGVFRYTMLVTVQTYVAERLAESGEEESVQKQHAAHFLDLAEEAESELDGPNPAIWMDRLELELNNLRAALQWADKFQQVKTGLRLSGAIWRFWQVRGHSAEALRRLESLLARSDNVAAVIRAKALNAAGNLALDQGDYGHAQHRLEEARLLWESLDNERGLAKTLNNLGLAAMNLGDYGQGRKYLQSCLSIAHSVESLTSLMGHAYNNLGIASLYQGHYDQAVSNFKESVAFFRAAADKRGSSLPLGNLAQTLYAQGDYDQALAFQEEALDIKHAVGDKEEIAVTLQVYGLIYTDQGNYKEAARYFHEAIELCRQHGYRHHLGFLLDHLALTWLYRGEVKRAVDYLQESFQLLQIVGDRRGIAQVKNDLGLVARVKGDFGKAAVLHQEALALRREIADENGILQSLQALSFVASEQGNDHQARVYCQESLALSLKLGKKPTVACGLERLATAVYQARPVWAARLLGAADSIRSSIGAPVTPIDQPDFESTRQAVRTALGEDAFTEAWAAGQKMSLETAVAYALQEEE